MEKIEIYVSKKKQTLLLIGSIIFIFLGIYFFLNVEIFTYRHRSLIFKKGIGIIAIIFSMFGIYISIKQLLLKSPLLIIDKKGININPRKSLSESIEWENINGFSEIKIHKQKIIIIDINNSNYWIEKEENKVRKTLMKFNFNNYGSPFNFSASPLQINHMELMKVLTENLNKYKYTG